MLVVASLVAESLTAHPLSRVGTSARTPSRAGCSASPGFLPASRVSRLTCGAPLLEAPEEVDAAARPADSAETRSLLSGIEGRLEALTRDPQLLLEAVVGLPYGVATYDRDAVLDYFRSRPQQMVARALDFLNAFRRVKASWEAGGDTDRGAMLRAELAALGPVAVKLGQTLSQRPDILPDDVCEALKALQTTNAPFPDEEAFRVIAEDFNATGPVAPGLPLLDGYDPDGPTLFKSLSATCIASASLGQVYKGETHDGRPIAVKVQRPGALRQCLLDGSVIIVALKAIQGRYWNGDLLAIFDTVAAGVVQELDFRNEAANGMEFKKSLGFLGYVDVPDTLPELTTRRAMAMEWVHGRHLKDLNPEEAMRMTYMSCEAVTAGLVLTGLVHADPHEGNIMLADDGRLVFLDFGLMSRVDDNIMEAFASGIQCVLSKDYVGLVQAFIDTGFVGSPIEWRPKDGDPWQQTHPSGESTTVVMAKELRERMESVSGGGSRFGALSVVLSDMGFTWQVDPSFNIYEVALPWAVQRALSPSTEAGTAALRSSVLTDDGRFQWERVDALIAEQKEQQQQERAEAAAAAAKAEGAAAGDAADAEADAGEMSGRARLMAQEANKAELDPAIAAAGAEAQAAQAATPLDSFVGVLGSPSGATLRRIGRDLDSTEFLLTLASPAARPMRRMAVEKAAEAIVAGITAPLGRGVRRSFARLVATAPAVDLAERWRVPRPTAAFTAAGGLAAGAAVVRPDEVAATMQGVVVPTNGAPAAAAAAAAAVPVVAAAASSAAATAQPWPTSEKADRLERRRASRARAAGLLLLRTHVSKQVAAGWRGAAAAAALVYVTLRVAIAAVARAALRTAGAAAAAALPDRVVVAAAAAAAAVGGWVGRELTAVGASATALADDLDAVARSKRRPAA